MKFKENDVIYTRSEHGILVLKILSVDKCYKYEVIFNSLSSTPKGYIGNNGSKNWMDKNYKLFTPLEQAML